MVLNVGSWWDVTKFPRQWKRYRRIRPSRGRDKCGALETPDLDPSTSSQASWRCNLASCCEPRHPPSGDVCIDHLLRKPLVFLISSLLLLSNLIPHSPFTSLEISAKPARSRAAFARDCSSLIRYIDASNNIQSNMVMNTATVGAAVTPAVVETFVTHVSQMLTIPKLC